MHYKKIYNQNSSYYKECYMGTVFACIKNFHVPLFSPRLKSSAVYLLCCKML